LTNSLRQIKLFVSSGSASPNGSVPMARGGEFAGPRSSCVSGRGLLLVADVQKTTNWELEKMVSSQQLRDKASRYYQLARSITSTRDIAHFEALGAEVDQAAANMEAEEDAAWLSRQNEPNYNGKRE
jgi:hypothetical protein